MLLSFLVGYICASRPRTVLPAGFAAAQDDIVDWLDYKILRARVMDHNRGRTLLGLQQES